MTAKRSRSRSLKRPAPRSGEDERRLSILGPFETFYANRAVFRIDRTAIINRPHKAKTLATFVTRVLGDNKPDDDLLSHWLQHYHRREVVSRSCSGWEGVVPTCYSHQA